MRRPRIKAAGDGYYHVVSRIGGRRFLIEDGEKAKLLDFIRRAAAFSGVEVYTYAMMSNHFHLLVHVPQRREVGEAELRKRMLALYGQGKLEAIDAKWAFWARHNLEHRIDEEKERIRARMYDLSQFCKTFKEAYTQDYNRRTGNTGTIWEGRFKSILLEGGRKDLLTVSSYIHLNPVRAGVVADPADTTWTGFGAAAKGDGAARKGLVAMLRHLDRATDVNWEKTHPILVRAMEGAFAEVSDEESPVRAKFDEGTVSQTKGQDRPPSSLRDLLRQRMAELIQGGVMGEIPFVRKIAARLPPRLRRRATTTLDACPFLSLETMDGVR